MTEPGEYTIDIFQALSGEWSFFVYHENKCVGKEKGIISRASAEIKAGNAIKKHREK